MFSTLSTPHLRLQLLERTDKPFILELVNTPGWLAFIGDRNIHTEMDADAYIVKINDNPDTTFWTVRQHDQNAPIGMISLIKRDYLPHPDIGFAFLPDFIGKGYAREAASATIAELRRLGLKTPLLATTVPDNTASIHLLKKLGLALEREITVDNEPLLLFSTATGEPVKQTK